MLKQNRTDIRPSPIAGSWYPGSPIELRQLLTRFLDKVEPPILNGKIRGLILPHAGLHYSGLTAAYALKAIEGQAFSRVIIVSPSHQAYHGHLLTSAHQAYRTPLGDVPVDQDALAFLMEELDSSGLSLNSIRNDSEHSIEIELPFLQFLLPAGFRLVPIMMMDQSLSTARNLAAVLAGLISSFPDTQPTLLIASSDLSHFYDQNQANNLDQRLIKNLANFDPKVFYALKSSRQAEACGFGAIAAVLLACQRLGASQVTISDYRTSGDISRDFNSVVGYVSAIITEGDHEQN